MTTQLRRKDWVDMRREYQVWKNPKTKRTRNETVMLYIIDFSKRKDQHMYMFKRNHNRTNIYKFRCLDSHWSFNDDDGTSFQSFSCFLTASTNVTASSSSTKVSSSSSPSHGFWSNTCWRQKSIKVASSSPKCAIIWDVIKSRRRAASMSSLHFLVGGSSNDSGIGSGGSSAVSGNGGGSQMVGMPSCGGGGGGNKPRGSGGGGSETTTGGGSGGGWRLMTSIAWRSRSCTNCARLRWCDVCVVSNDIRNFLTASNTAGAFNGSASSS